MLRRTLLFLLVCSVFPWSAGSAAPKFHANTVAIYDISSGKWLYRKNSRERRAPASTIKVLTALTAMKLCKEPARYVTVSRKAANTDPSKAGLKAGEEYRIIDLVGALLVASSNDAAVAIAEGISGSEEAFAVKMQEYAGEIGARSTVVTNASGLPDPAGMISTAEDSVIFMRRIVEDNRLCVFMAAKTFSIKSREGRETSLINHNRLLWRYQYEVRGKTGYTKLAKHCFTSIAEEGGRKVAVCVMGAPSSSRLWQDVQRANLFCFQDVVDNLPTYMRSQGITIVQLHSALENAGFAVSGEDGTYGQLTKEKVKAFQKSRGLDVDGIVGPHTWRALKEAVK